MGLGTAAQDAQCSLALSEMWIARLVPLPELLLAPEPATHLPKLALQAWSNCTFDVRLLSCGITRHRLCYSELCFCHRFNVDGIMQPYIPGHAAMHILTCSPTTRKTHQREATGRTEERCWTPFFPILGTLGCGGTEVDAGRGGSTLVSRRTPSCRDHLFLT